MKITNFEELIYALQNIDAIDIFDDVKKSKITFCGVLNDNCRLIYNDTVISITINFNRRAKEEVLIASKDPQKILDVIIAIKNCED